MAKRTIKWAVSKECIDEARLTNAMVFELESGEKLGETLKRIFNIDVTDPRQLHMLILAMFESKIIFLVVCNAHAEYFGFDSAQSIQYLRNMQKNWASVTLALAEYLPTQVSEGGEDVQKVNLPPIKYDDFAWYTLLPTPHQVEEATAWRRSLPTHQDDEDDDNPREDRENTREKWQDKNSMNLPLAFIWMVCMLLTGLLAANPATDGAEAPECAVRFRDMMLATTFELLPPKYQAIARNT